MKQTALLCGVVLGWVCGFPAMGQPVDTGVIRNGVSEVTGPGSPGAVCVFGPHASVVVAGKGDGKTLVPVVAASKLGAGRAVALGHTGYLDPANLAKLQTGRLMVQALRWAATQPIAGDGGGVDVAVVDNPALVEWLKAMKFDAKGIKPTDLNERELKPFEVLVLSQGALSDKQILEAREFVAKEGHGLVIAATGWGWLQLNPGKQLWEHPGNRLIADAGLVFTDGMAGETIKDGFKVGDTPVSPLLNASSAVDLLEQVSAGAASTRPGADDILQASATATIAARVLPDSDGILLPRIRALAGQHAGSLVPTAKHPLDAKKPLERFLLAYEVRRIEALPVEQVRPYPSAADFPGVPPENAPRIEATVSVDARVPGWHSTGLYAAPGETITVTSEGDKAFRVQIGCHKDTLWHKDSWQRVPDIVSSWPLGEASKRVASAFGGLVYVIVPDQSDAGERRLVIRGAVQAPRFTLGRTTNEQWKAIRELPGPWAELESEKVILTVPSVFVRTLDDPESLMRFWDSVSDAHADLASIPRARRRPERYVADIQISAGYMHSGYPIMTHLDAAGHMTMLPDLKSGRHAWGLFHELGHNHQAGEWTFEGTGEVTCNLFTLHALETVCNLPKGQRGHDGVDKPPKSLDQYLAKPDFAKWKSDPFLALWMYVQLRDEFGWEPFKKVFAEYRGLSKDQRPRTDDEERDQWMVRFSRAVGKNLGPFFDAWGVPTSVRARESIKDLPDWMPPGMPAPK